ncbi:MAG: GGDEF domain-containing protein [Oleibacter sp.]|nr:GGDEF domain-containing protein [Thalassolituus sp.]
MPAEAIECPLGETQCPLIDELSDLRLRVITDPLTELFNVRHMRVCLEQELERTSRTTMPTAFMMIDLDHFKSINDTYGHENGNKVLIHVAQLLLLETRKLDVCCRYGGEEFAIILPSTSLMLARQVAERIRLTLENSFIQLDADTAITVTASIGLAMIDRHSGESDFLISEADKALYQAKKNGRNGVAVSYSPKDDAAVNGDEKAAIGQLFSQ